MAVQIRGLREFQRELRKADASLSNAMRKVHRRVADLIALRTKAAMAGDGRQAARAAAGVKPRATNTSASIDTVSRPGFTLAVIWGQRRRSGWFAAQRYEGSTGRQFREWVGNQWDPGDHGGKPYYLGDVMNASLDEVEDIYMEGVDDLMRRAFPD